MRHERQPCLAPGPRIRMGIWGIGTPKDWRRNKEESFIKQLEPNGRRFRELARVASLASCDSTGLPGAMKCRAPTLISTIEVAGYASWDSPAVGMLAAFPQRVSPTLIRS